MQDERRARPLCSEFKRNVAELANAARCQILLPKASAEIRVAVVPSQGGCGIREPQVV